MACIDHRSHGGRRRELAAAAGLSEEELLDFSANINPAGPPPWLDEALREGARRIGFYPDPDSSEAREAAARRFGLPPDHFLFADGADSLILALPRALAVSSCILPSPSYSGYLRAASRVGARILRPLLQRREAYSMAGPAFLASLEEAIRKAPEPRLVFLGAPNNPVGAAIPEAAMLELAAGYRGAYFAVDESFAELAGLGPGLAGRGAPNILVLRSLTKSYAVPGARVGFVSAEPGLLSAIRAELSAWPMSSFAQAIATRALDDADFAARSAALVAAEESVFVAELEKLGGIVVYRSGANFLLLEFSSEFEGERVAAELLRRGVAVRRFSEAEGLDRRYARVAVRFAAENGRFIAALAAALAASDDRDAGRVEP